LRHVRIENDSNREPRFWVQAEADADCHRVLARGELDLAAVPALEQAVTQAEQGGGARIVLDLAGVTFIDSSGVHFLLRTSTRLAAEGRFRVTRPSPAVQNMIELSGIGKLLPMDE
jgi:anti-anti-sigma factor